MTSSEQIRALCIRSAMSLSELARRMGQTPQNFHAKLKRDTVSQQEMMRIAAILQVQYEQYFLLSNGEMIK